MVHGHPSVEDDIHRLENIRNGVDVRITCMISHLSTHDEWLREIGIERDSLYVQFSLEDEGIVAQTLLIDPLIC